MNDNLRFMRRFLADPIRLGAISPASTRLGYVVGSATRAAAALVSNTRGLSNSELRRSSELGHGGAIVELGAGTGSLTKHIMSLNPVLVEGNEQWAALLKTRFPQLEIRVECATATLRGISEPVGVVSSIPLLNNPTANVIKRLMSSKYRQGLIRFCVAYTYGWSNPLADVGFFENRRERFVFRNLPPAFVWTYR